MLDNALTSPPEAGPELSEGVSSGRVFEILRESAVKAFITALLVTILSQVALGIVSGILRDMTPSLPPLLTARPASHGHGAWAPGWSSLKSHRLSILFGVFFVGIAGARLAEYSSEPRIRKGAARLKWGFRHVSRHWFGSIVGNTFYAFVLVFALSLAQHFSPAQWLFKIIAAVVHPMAQSIASVCLGADATAAVGRLIDWWSDNQIKLAFWSLYVAAIGDDLGFPNYKTLGWRLWRWFWGRLQKSIIPGPSPRVLP
jgi:hypothetical protein